MVLIFRQCFGTSKTTFHLTQGLKLPELRFKFLSNLEDF